MSILRSVTYSVIVEKFATGVEYHIVRTWRAVHIIMEVALHNHCLSLPPKLQTTNQPTNQ